MSTATDTGTERKIFQSTDFQRSYRIILDEAKRGLARIRDKDGLSLVVVPEGSFETLESKVRDLETISAAMSSWLTIHEAVVANRVPTIAEFGEWPFLDVFDAEDLEEFVGDMASVILYAAKSRGDLARLEECLRAWRTTANVLQNSQAREVLLGAHDPAQFVDAEPPDQLIGAGQEPIPAVSAGS